ncbi:MAG: DUF4178 domain-containing protein [Cyanobacteria bacterium QH_8_48_120]|jgi:hypothetical protein|nr:MAG: DUF4178 domain-containing protein [Cyanobacteria bacterium QH_1_48_107]PSO59045.1 MAG: DUF4178 domain-containing protein [Cyanobacteria bacterium QH_2_48_84]PSO60822.1 MAG: DUF4178 domain-containing protein [Cyanobacteria bacterium QH_10_48_56]PSO62021.1 MAG: DUF4178 domain-containing protein [Cyanobacteria bacterium QH_6_48_35]PSO63275.1 MAG: DUF4178 domain-containing protein [Cyanobacteria bacterium QH_7_48_89]PSO71837.1 MAG: DUF4178 domain-containing protein [Cyanobacteria bacterium
MLWLVWIGIIAIVAAGVVLVIRQQRLEPSSQQGETPPLERTIFTLQIGDIVQYMDADWVVEGKLTYEEDGFSWYEYMLQDGDRIRWLSVEEDDLVEVAWLEATNSLDVSSHPPQQINFAGDSYRCMDSGVAQMTRKGNVQRRKAQQCRFFDYEAAEGKVLSVEDWNGEIEVTVGQRIRPSDLSLLPGSGGSIYRS